MKFRQNWQKTLVRIETHLQELEEGSAALRRSEVQDASLPLKNLRADLADLRNQLTELTDQTLHRTAGDALERLLAESSPDMIFMINRRDQVIYVNESAAQGFGVEREEILGEERSSLFPPDIAGAQTPALAHVLETGEKVHTESKVAFPGREAWLSTWLVPVREGEEVTAVMGVSRDISERKQAEMELARSEQLLQLIVNAIPALVSYVDQEYRYRFVNQAYQELFDLPLDEILGAEAPEVIGEEAFRSVREDLDRALQGEHVRYRREMAYTTGTRWTASEFVPDVNPDGMVEGLIAIVRDITEQVRMEHDLEAKISDLERFNRAAVDRELEMIELKKQVNQLKREQGEEPPFDLAFTEG